MPSLQTQVASLRANANRLPVPFADLLLKAAGTFEGDLTNSSRAQLAQALGDQVTGPVSRSFPTAIPFTRGSTLEISLADFGRMFGPGEHSTGSSTSISTQLVDRSQRDWTWRQDNALARTLSPATLREFQRAAQIRDAFFATGGNMPSITLAVVPPAASRGQRHQARHQRHGGREQAGL